MTFVAVQPELQRHDAHQLRAKRRSLNPTLAPPSSCRCLKEQTARVATCGRTYDAIAERRKLMSNQWSRKSWDGHVASELAPSFSTPPPSFSDSDRNHSNRTLQLAKL